MRRDEKGHFKSDAPYRDNLGTENKHKTSIAGRRGEIEGVSDFTIHQNQKFAKGIDAIKEVAPDLADKILKPKPEGPRLSKTQENINHTPDRTGMAA